MLSEKVGILDDFFRNAQKYIIIIHLKKKKMFSLSYQNIDVIAVQIGMSLLLKKYNT
jgi:hypothetical protein